VGIGHAPIEERKMLVPLLACAEVIWAKHSQTYCQP
jgi:hypothetical protein